MEAQRVTEQEQSPEISNKMVYHTPDIHFRKCFKKPLMCVTCRNTYLREVVGLTFTSIWDFKFLLRKNYNVLDKIYLQKEVK